MMKKKTQFVANRNGTALQPADAKSQEREKQHTFNRIHSPIHSFPIKDFILPIDFHFFFRISTHYLNKLLTNIHWNKTFSQN